MSEAELRATEGEPGELASLGYNLFDLGRKSAAASVKSGSSPCEAEDELAFKLLLVTAEESA